MTAAARKLVCQPVNILDLTLSTCRWPVSGDGFEMQYCGADSPEGRPYCAVHHARAYQKAATTGNELRRSLRKYSS